jgi:hypothetical protein
MTPIVSHWDIFSVTAKSDDLIMEIRKTIQEDSKDISLVVATVILGPVQFQAPVMFRRMYNPISEKKHFRNCFHVFRQIAPHELHMYWPSAHQVHTNQIGMLLPLQV